MKCGGSSLVYSLKFWFNLVYDHLVDPKKINEFIHNKYDLEIINSDTCIVGHFAYDGIYLFQRYPELLKNDKIKVFTFIREPLDFYVSFYYYSKNQGRLNNISLVDFLESNRDLLAYYLPCDEDNYKEVLDRYFFIGITEHMQSSFDKLAEILNKRKMKVPFSNKSEKDSQISILSKEYIKSFKKKNKLDYKIYKYCLNHFNKLSKSI